MSELPVKKPRGRQPKAKVQKEEIVQSDLAGIEPIEPLPIADEVKFMVSEMTTYKDQEINISPIIKDIIPSSYVWKKDGTVIKGEVSRSLKLISSEEANGAYTVEVTDTTGTKHNSDTITITNAEVPENCKKEYEFNFDEYLLGCKIGLHWKMVEDLDKIVESEPAADAFIKKLQSKIATNPELFTFYCGFVKCNGNVLAQDSRNGYFSSYEANTKKGDGYKYGSYTTEPFVA